MTSGVTPGQIAAVITCHDLGGLVLEALESVERQTRPPAEIVIVDDASTDIHTRQLLARLERQGTCVARADGRGASAARNLGARLTSSAYLVCLDGDDVLEPRYFETAAARLDADAGLDFVSCALRAFGAASYVWSPSSPTFVDAVATGGVPHASTMVRRRLWETIGGFDEDIPSFELLDFWASALERGFQGIVLDEPLLNYRIRHGSGYRLSIQPATYLSRLRHLYTKHRASVEQHGLDLIHAKEAFLLSQREYHGVLESRVAALEAELAQLQLDITETARLLESRGSSRIEWGDLRRVDALSQLGGRDRGKPIERHYIDGFLGQHRADIRGRVLEARDRFYTQRFGGNAVEASDVVDVDLRRADAIPTSTYDCIILTQTLQLIDDVAAILAECARILRPGGVLLATIPSVSRIDEKRGRSGDFWRLTEASARTLFAEVFPIDAFDVRAYGNVMACTASLHGISVEEMAPAELDQVDSAFPLVIAIRAVKPAETPSDVRSAGRSGPHASALNGPRHNSYRGAILAYHRVGDLTPDSHRLCTPPAVFREHMAYVRDHFSPIGLDDLVRAAATGRIPEGAVAITFDDGYFDALTVASPILEEFGLPATFFVNTDRLDEPHERWWDILERVLLSDIPAPPELATTVDGRVLRIPTKTARERCDALELLNRTAWPMDAAARQALVDHVLAWSGTLASARATHRVLTTDEVRTLASRPGHTIGAHTVHHLALTTQSSETKRREVVESKDALERALQRPVTLFAYPYGDFDGELVRTVGEAGFHTAVTVEAGLVSAGVNRLLLPRCEITPSHRGEAFAIHLREVFECARV
jgi:peptidoglycan/xylan/chitin deacetylase (PgdA/CDA1 family)/glycosyltransferase involved in cell wall biosynthesis/SAM-dependent methyltransferase